MSPADIRKLRKRLGLTQPSFAKLLGVSEITVSRWENGRLGLSSTTRTLLELLAAQSATTKTKPRRGRSKNW